VICQMLFDCVTIKYDGCRMRSQVFMSNNLLFNAVHWNIPGEFQGRPRKCSGSDGLVDSRESLSME
jgi:hypothetical protein